MQILPSGLHPAPKKRSSALRTVLGWSYVVLSAVFSCLYIVLLNPATLNDMWWANYSSTHHQALLIDTFNTMLPTHSTGAMDLLSPHTNVAKQYLGHATTTEIYPTYPRRLVMTELTSMEYAVRNLRVLSAQETVWIGTQYCWVDLARHFEVAHTQARQNRCRDLYAANGAVYLETILRNIVWDDFVLYFGQSDGPFGMAILNWLEQVPEGQRWIAATAAARQTTSEADEVAYWTANAITDFTLQWQNDYITGISEVFVLENSLAMRQEIILNNIPTVECTWTSFILYFALLNDIMTHQMFNRSLIRSANNSILQDPPLNMEFEVVGVSDENQDMAPQIQLFRTSIGPMLSIDTWLVAVPASALDFYRQFQLHLQSTLDSNAAFNQLVHATRPVTLSPTPQAWADPNLLFYGGNPMCLLGTPQTFVQQTFGFYDICDRQLPLTADLTPSSVLFAMAAMHFDVDVAVVCRLVAEPEVCHSAMNALLGASRLLDVLIPRGQIDRVVEDVRAEHPGIMQFSTDVDGANWTMLFQPLLDNSSFDIFSWTFVVDWIEGKREVVRFEGDAGSMALVSMPETVVHFSSSTAYVTDATRTIFYMVVYMTLLIVVIALGCIVASARSTTTKRRHSNLMWFNQVVGSVWIGRPLLLLRGCTAVMLLSSTQLEPWSADGVRTRFTMAPRSWCAIVVIAGEATWLSYVAADFLTITTRRFTRVFAPPSYVISWAVLIALEAYDPVYPVAGIDRKCAAQNMDQTLKCSSGVVQVGSFTRTWVIVAVQIVCFTGAIAAATVRERWSGQQRSRRYFERHMLGVADNFYELDNSKSSKECFASHDTASWLMAGLVHIPVSKNVLLDVKLWLLTKRMPTGTIRVLTSMPTMKHVDTTDPWYVACIPKVVRRHERRIFGAFGVFNAICSILGSISYLQVSQVNLANDLMWATFNMSGAHAFTANWLNDQLVLGATAQVVRLDVAGVNDDKPYDQANGEVTSAPNVGGLLQYTELNTIEATIAGLRTTDECSVPWIFTQYCYVDFDQRWELANTEVRQQRCKAMATNGAVFLESVLRNIDVAAFRHCWGDAFDVAIANELKLTVDGQTWLDMVSTNDKKPSVATEAAYWRNAGVRHFTTQWQNFKTIGLVNEYSISNVYGIAYPFSLETSYSAFRLERESTLKFYWAFANDLATVSRNNSAVVGASLVRSSGSFAFANESMESALFQRGTLTSPLSASFELVQSIIGPFGSVDMHHVPCPVVLKQLVHHVHTVLRQTLALDETAPPAYFSILDGMFLMHPVPRAWLDLDFYSMGGSLLCPESGARLVSFGLQGFTSLSRQCFFIPLAAGFPFVRKNTVAATVLSQIAAPPAIDAACNLVQDVPTCLQTLNSSIEFTASYMAPQLDPQLDAMIANATDAIMAAQIELVQFGVQDEEDTMQLHRTLLLDPVNNPEFVFFSWIILVDWALGYREVVAFAGDVGNLTVITEFELAQKQQVNSAQFPVYFAGYLRNAVWYITSTFLFIAVVLLVYVVLCRGHVEVLNLYKLQRVGAIVWVGRPFLFVRSVTALGLLSTATLELRSSGFVTYFESVQLPLVKTCLAANEITWLAAVVNDLALVLTHEYTSYYSTTNSFLVWAIMASISLALPMTHSMAIDKQCHLAQVDFQVVCTSGTLAIGRPTRFGILIAIVLVSNVVCYTITRRLVDKPQKTQLKSVFLYAGAKYMFTTADWIDDDVYFMDRMSAAMNGILTVHVGDIMYALDVKLWCTFQVDLTDQLAHFAEPRDLMPSPLGGLVGTVLGCTYITFSAVCSCIFVYLLNPPTMNDVWWANYTTTREQAMLVDVFNAMLPTQANGSVDLLAPRAIVDKVYGELSATTDIYPTYPRRLVMTEFTSVEHAVLNLRSLKTQESVWIGTQYCWVDFRREFEVAHTQGRQDRCNATYSSNGAVYLEAIMRNMDWDEYMQYYGGDEGMFTVAILSWLQQVPTGQEWIASTSVARQVTTVPDEIAYWKRHSIASFTLQWQNDYLTGISEVMVLENALGMRQEVVLNNIPTVECTWTAFVLYFAFMNDLVGHSMANRSMIRSADNSVLQEPAYNMEKENMGVSDGDEMSVPLYLFRTTFGPFLSVDTWLVGVPPSAIAWYHAFESAFRTVTAADLAMDVAARSIPDVTFHPTPKAWADPSLMFYGGNPMCLLGQPLPFAQQTFGFYDICDRQNPLTVDMSFMSGIFSAVAMNVAVDVESTCATVSVPSHCPAVLANVQAISRSLALVVDRPLVDQARRDVQELHLGLMQFAADAADEATNRTLFEALFDEPTFDFFSWIFVLDWIQGTREVVRFEGDAGTLALISMVESPVHFTSSVSYVTSATRYIFYLVSYTTFIVVTVTFGCVVGTIATMGATKMNNNYAWFNQIVGSVWIGRPLLILRGSAAILLLSTAQLSLVSGHDVSSRFVFRPRTWLRIFVIAGEATWMLYVVTDFLTIATRRFTKLFAPLSYATSWAALFVLELQYPILPVAYIDRACSAQSMDQTIKCSSGVVRIGSFDRVCLIVLIQIIALGGALILAKAFQIVSGKREGHVEFERHMLGVADNFYPLDNSKDSLECYQSHDVASWLMAGLVHIPGYKDSLLDIKLWLLHQKTKAGTLRVASFHSLRQLGITKGGRYRKYIPKTIRHHKKQVLSCVGVLYAVGSIVGSVSYLQVSEVNLANDLLWAKFNMTGTHTFTANWLNEQLVLRAPNDVVHLDVEAINDDKPYDDANGMVLSAPNVGGLLQYTELNTIDATIAGLRTTDACSVPWIFTQYCFVDFNQRWELANTEARQERCKAMTSNGAVFLEAVLRNIDFAAFRHCWGGAFDVAIADELKQTSEGQAWLSTMSNQVKPTIPAESALWRGFGVAHFTTQWQNFKTIGLVNEYTISNVYSLSYPFALETSFSIFRLERETTMKYYWAFANDLASVWNNASAVAGMSLIRSSPSFAFANVSMEALLFEKELIVAPLVPSFGILASVVGPFGAVDMYHMPCPVAVKDVVRTLSTAVRQPSLDTTRPKSPGFSTLGGSILCPAGGAKGVVDGMQGLTSMGKQCSFIPLSATIPFYRRTILPAVILSQLASATFNDVVSICTNVTMATAECTQLLNSSTSFVASFMAAVVVDPAIVQSITRATDAVHAMNIELVQFGVEAEDAPVEMHRIRVLDADSADFSVFAWTMFVDWAMGFREVVMFSGDVSNITVLTEFELPRSQQVNQAQFPVNFAVYLRSAVMYITSTLIFMAALMLLYIIGSVGNVEVGNLFKMQRVGAIVWIGRPFLFLRSLTAIGLLSTSTLELHYSGHITYFETTRTPLYKTFLAASEVTWLVAVVNDIGLAFTQEYTRRYASPNSMLVWFVMAGISILFPMPHSMAIDKQCRLAQVDAQVVCTSGNLTIGQPMRLVLVVAIVFVCNVVCYITTRLLVGPPKPTPLKSVFLYAGAKYLFKYAGWIDNKVYYMDRMSAAMNGVMTIRYANVMYGLDMKLWCTFQVDLAEFAPHTPAAKYGLPLKMTNDY